MGGETLLEITTRPAVAGLSPRGRGNHAGPHRPSAGLGSIPAWAGKPRRRRGAGHDTKVYPRVGGETGSDLSYARIQEGLSPRGRGNRDQHAGGADRAGSIPAWAGKPATLAVEVTLLAVYPRVGGETVTSTPAVQIGLGLSPRGRGNPSRGQDGRIDPGSIPAWAGKPCRSPSRTPRAWVYPRVGGETAAAGALGAPPSGLSPRGRGNRTTPARDLPGLRSIPAWAGKPI